MPGPGEPVLIAAGVLAAQHRLDIGSVVFVAWVAASVGGAIGWAFGRGAGRAILTAPGPLYRLRLRSAKRGEEVFARYRVLAIVVMPTWVAGILRVRPLVFLVVDTLAAAVWAAGFGLGAYFIGPSVIDGVKDVGVATAVGVVVVIGLGVGLEVRRRRSGPRRAGDSP